MTEGRASARPGSININLILRVSGDSDHNSRQKFLSKGSRKPGHEDLPEKMWPIGSGTQALHQQKPDGSSDKHSDNEQDDNRRCETQHGNQSGMRHELSQPSPQGDLAHDSRNEHEGKQTETYRRMLATWKATARFAQVTICFHFSRHHEELYPESASFPSFRPQSSNL